MPCLFENKKTSYLKSFVALLAPVELMREFDIVVVSDVVVVLGGAGLIGSAAGRRGRGSSSNRSRGVRAAAPAEVEAAGDSIFRQRLMALRSSDPFFSVSLFVGKPFSSSWLYYRSSESSRMTDDRGWRKTPLFFSVFLFSSFLLWEGPDVAPSWRGKESSRAASISRGGSGAYQGANGS